MIQILNGLDSKSETLNQFQKWNPRGHWRTHSMNANGMRTNENPNTMTKCPPPQPIESVNTFRKIFITETIPIRSKSIQNINHVWKCKHAHTHIHPKLNQITSENNGKHFAMNQTGVARKMYITRDRFETLSTNTLDDEYWNPQRLLSTINYKCYFTN